MKGEMRQKMQTGREARKTLGTGDDLRRRDEKRILGVSAYWEGLPNLADSESRGCLDML